jgi:hypothetical protein
MSSGGEPDVDAAVALVFRWLRAYREYEIEMAREDERAEQDDRLDEFEMHLRKAFAGLQARFMSPRVITKGLSPAFGSPPTANPDATVLVSATRRGDTVTIIAKEPAQHALVAPYEVRYRVRDTELGLRIDQRHFRGPSGRWTEEGT